MTPELYDTHCHLDYADFREDQGEVIQRALEAGVTRMVAVGTDFASSRAAIELAERYEAIWAAVGWHPGHALEAPGEGQEGVQDNHWPDWRTATPRPSPPRSR